MCNPAFLTPPNLCLRFYWADSMTPMLTHWQHSFSPICCLQIFISGTWPTIFEHISPLSWTLIQGTEDQGLYFSTNSIRTTENCKYSCYYISPSSWRPLKCQRTIHFSLGFVSFFLFSIVTGVQPSGQLSGSLGWWILFGHINKIRVLFSCLTLLGHFGLFSDQLWYF